MKILLITQEDVLAGSSFSVSYLAKGLSLKGHDVIVAARSGSILEEQFQNSDVVFEPISIRSRFNWKSINEVAKLVRKYQIQIVNAQSSKDRYITVFAKFLFKLPVALIHTRRQVSLSLGGFFQNMIYVWGTDKIVAVSHGVKESLLNNRIPDKHIKVIHNGTPPEKYQHISTFTIEKLKQKFSIQPHDLVIGCISRRKKQDQLLRSLDSIGYPVKVILIGIHEDEELKKIQSEFIYPHQINYEGEVEPSLALHYYKLFTCTVLCSTTEGLSQGLLESMYLGSPVIATAAAGNLDLIQDGKNGLLFNEEDTVALAESIKKIAGDQKLRDSLILGGINTATDTFSIKRTVSAYEEFYVGLLSSRKRYLHEQPKTIWPHLPSHSSNRI